MRRYRTWRRSVSAERAKRAKRAKIRRVSLFSMDGKGLGPWRDASSDSPSRRESAVELPSKKLRGAPSSRDVDKVVAQVSQPAVSQCFQPANAMKAFPRRCWGVPADWKSAIQQVGNLRYVQVLGIRGVLPDFVNGPAPSSEWSIFALALRGKERNDVRKPNSPEFMPTMNFKQRGSS